MNWLGGWKDRFGFLLVQIDIVYSYLRAVTGTMVAARSAGYSRKQPNNGGKNQAKIGSIAA